MPSSRKAAFEILSQWKKSPSHVFAEPLLAEYNKNTFLSAKDAGLVKALVLGVLQTKSVLNYWIDEWATGKVSASTRTLLQIGLYQILYLRIPDHAAVNETVALSEKRSVTKFANAILRRATREKSQVLRRTEELPLHIRYSLPSFIISRWNKHFGACITKRICALANQPAPLTMRLNALNAGDQIAIPEDASPMPAEHRFLRIKSIPHDILNAGQGYIQDPSTALACDLLSPSPGENVLDACAAPGGKSCLLAEHMNNQGILIACDSSQPRLATLTENLHRQNVTIASTCRIDWTQLTPSIIKESFPHPFDKILVDVPCSNTGVIRRRHDVRWRLTPESFDTMAMLQEKILLNVFHLLRPGGYLVYSTCSIEPEENERLVARALKNLPKHSLLRDHTLLPTQDHDGAYAALIARH
ncbi:MAG: transcription antitermination factor NusB [Verrucomicrobiota bacterium]